MKSRIILIIFLFCYIYPVFLKFFPIPTDRIIQIFGLVILLLSPKYSKNIFLNKNLLNIFFASIAISIFTYLVQIWNISKVDLYFFKDVSSVLFYFLSSSLICYTLLKIDNSNIFIKLLDYIVIIAFIQCIISLVFFFYRPSFDIYSNLLSSSSNSKMIERLGLIERRLMGVGSAFFSGVIKYGVAFLIMIVLPYFKQSFFYRKKVLYTCILTFIIIGGLMTGRTFLVVLILGLLLFLSIKLKNFIHLFIKVIPLTLISSSLIYFLASYFIDLNKIDTILNFVFEIFINFEETGNFSTTSSNATLDMYKFPNNYKTWIIGDGRMMLEDGSYYMGSDVGLVRLIFYFGLIGLFFYLIYQFVLFKNLINLVNNTKLIKLFLALFVWVIFLNSKGLANIDVYIVLFVVVGGYQKFVINKRNKRNANR